jgi:hypothetical protein
VSDPASTRRPPLAAAVLPLVAWSVASLGLLALAAFGPKLWASQRGDDAKIAVEIVAVGQLLLAAVAWPIWTKSLIASAGVVVTAPLWLLLAGQLAHRTNGAALSIAWKLMAVLMVLALLRAPTPRPGLAYVWALLTTVALGAPVLYYLARDF